MELQGEPFQPEIVLNLWYVMDAETEMIYSILGRAYHLAGTEEDKLHVLRQLAVTDHVIAKIGAIPERFKNVTSHGEMKGAVIPSILRQYENEIFEGLIKELDVELPLQRRLRDDQPYAKRNHISESPLRSVTCLVEDKDGNRRAIV